MPADSEPDIECDHSQNWVMIGKAKQNKGVKWVSNPHVKRNKRQHLSTSLTWNTPPPVEGPLPLVEGGFIPSNKDN